VTWKGRLNAVIDSWEGTRYLDGHAARGVGVDCVRFVDCVLQELFRVKLPPLPILHPETSIHCGREVVRMGLLIRDRFASETIRHPRACMLQPGDVVVQRWRTNRYPGHVGIVDARGKLWHSTQNSGVHFGSLAGGKFVNVRCYRPDRKSSWA